METVFLGKSNISVSRIGFGCCPMGGHGWGEVNKDDIIRAVQVALDNKINLFDTADVYGLGESERTLRVALGSRRSEAVIASKYGVRRDSAGKTFYDNSTKWMNEAIDSTLTRLGTDYLDLYQVHYYDGITPWDEIILGLDKLRSDGKIRFAGLSNVSEESIKKLNLPEWFVSIQLQLSLLETDFLNFTKESNQRFGLTPLSWGSLSQGLLTGKYDLKNKFPDNDRRSREVYRNFHGDRAEKSHKIVELIKDIGTSRDRTPGNVAIRWILDTIPNSVALIGIKKTIQLQDNINALGWHLTPDELEMLSNNL